ncbi:MAG: HlyD family secretion protein [Candidatus Aminicenantales bacterium]
MKKRATKFLGWVLAFLAVGFSAGCRPKTDSPEGETPALDMSPSQVVGIGRVEPELRILDLRSEVSGAVAGIFVRAGDVVTRGWTLVELTSAIEKAGMELKEAQVRSRRSQIDAARASLGSMSARAENARLTFIRARNLSEQGAQPRSFYDAAKAEYESLLEDIKKLEADLVAAEDILKQAQAEHRLSQAEYDRRFIKARVDGQILSLDITLGSLVSPDETFGTFAPASPLVARVEIDELFASLVLPGQKANLRAPGMTEVLGRGTVTFAGPSLRKKSLFSDDVGTLEDRRVREIWVTLDPGSPILFGTRVEAVISLEEP